jgi:hypothetical protein
VLRQFDANAYAASVRVYATKAAHNVTPPHHETPVLGILNSSSMMSPTKVTAMKTILIYDRPMCCSTGICGPSVDPVLPRFAADLDTMKNAGTPSNDTTFAAASGVYREQRNPRVDLQQGHRCAAGGGGRWTCCQPRHLSVDGNAADVDWRAACSSSRSCRDDVIANCRSGLLQWFDGML